MANLLQRTWKDGWTDRTAVPVVFGRMLEVERTERRYTTDAAYHRESELLAKTGWQITSVDDPRPHGEFARAFDRARCRMTHRDAPVVIVRYRRQH